MKIERQHSKRNVRRGPPREELSPELQATAGGRHMTLDGQHRASLVCPFLSPILRTLVAERNAGTCTTAAAEKQTTAKHR